MLSVDQFVLLLPVKALPGTRLLLDCVFQDPEHHQKVIPPPPLGP